MEHTKENFAYVSKREMYEALGAMLSREVNRLNTADTPDELHQSTRRWLGALEFIHLVDPTFDTVSYHRDHRIAFARNWNRLE